MKILWASNELSELSFYVLHHSPFYATGLFLYPLKTSGFLMFSGGCSKLPVPWNGLISICVARITITTITIITPSEFPGGNYMFKVNNRNTRTRREICSKLTIKTIERRHWCCTVVFIVNFEYISRLVLVFLLLTLNM